MTLKTSVLSINPLNFSDPGRLERLFARPSGVKRGPETSANPD